MDPPVLTKQVISEGFDIADEAAPGCLAGGGVTLPPAAEADPPDAVIWVDMPGCRSRGGDPAPPSVRADPKGAVGTAS